MIRSITRILVAFAVMLLMVLFAGPIADALRGVRALGLEAILTAAAVCLFLFVTVKELVRQLSAPSSVRISAPDVGPVESVRVNASGVGRMARKVRQEELHRTARHEAAHAVVALALGRTRVHTHVIPTGTKEGSTSFGDRPGEPAVDMLFARLVVMVAGFVHDFDDGVHDDGSASDLGLAHHHALRILSAGQRPSGMEGPLTVDGLFTHATAVARRILQGEAAQVNAIASALAERHTLDVLTLQSYPIRPVTLPGEMT